MIKIKFIDEPYSKYRLGKIYSYNSFDELLKLENFDEIKFIFCQFAGLSSGDIKILPKQLLVLDCENNNITYFSNLPKNLRILRTKNNKLTEMPKLPNSITLFESDFENMKNYEKRNNYKIYSIYKLPKISKIMELQEI